MKKRVYFLLFVLIFALCCVFIGCNCSDGGDEIDGGGRGTIEYGENDSRNPNELSKLNAIKLNMEKWEKFQLTWDGVASAEVGWLSRNEAVATVDKGLVIAVGKGTALIIAEYNGEEYRCVVNVSDEENVPVIKTNVENDILNIIKDDCFYIDVSLYYNGKACGADEVSVDFEFKGENIVGRDGYKLTGNTVGSGELVIKASWHGITVDKTIELNVVSSLTANLADEPELCLFTLDWDGRKVSENLNVSVYKDGEKLIGDEYAIEFDDEYDHDVIGFEESTKTVSALAAGRTTLVATVKTPKEDPDDQVKVYLPVIVRALERDKTETTLTVDLSDNGYVVNKNDIFDDLDPALLGEIEVTAVKDVTGENAIELAYDKVAGKIDTQNFGKKILGERIWTVETNKINYTVKVVVATKVIETAAEFNSLQSDFGATAENYYTYGKDCYFILGNDIDFSTGEGVDKVYGRIETKARDAADGADRGTDPETGFLGTFDGRGHSLSGFIIDRYDKDEKTGSLFGNIGKTGVVKNLTVKDYELAANGTKTVGDKVVTVYTDNSATIAWSLNQGTIENVNVIYTGKTVAYHHGYLAYRIVADSTVKNVNLYSSAKSGYGVATTFNGGTNVKFSGVNIVIGSNKLTLIEKYDGELKSNLGINYVLIYGSKFVWGERVRLTGRERNVDGLTFKIVPHNEVYGAWVNQDGVLSVAVGCKASTINVTGTFEIAGENQIFNIPVTETGDVTIDYLESEFAIVSVSGDTGYTILPQTDGGVNVQLQPSAQDSVYRIVMPKISYTVYDHVWFTVIYNYKDADLIIGDDVFGLTKDAPMTITVRNENGTVYLCIDDERLLLNSDVANGTEALSFRISRKNDAFATVLFSNIMAANAREKSSEAAQEKTVEDIEWLNGEW